MLVFTHTITPRLQYIADFIGKQVSREPAGLTTSIDAFRNFEGPRINYTNERLSSKEIWIRPHSLLFEEVIKEQDTTCFDLRSHKAFFRTEGDTGFDIFAASFYLLSRYEEYLPYKKDIYGRYAHENSLAFKNGFLDLPLVDMWVEGLRIMLKEKYPQLTVHRSRFTFLPTYDIDEAYSYKYKDTWRTMGGMVKAALKGNWERISERKKVLRGKSPDPFDSYEWIDALHSKHHLNPRYFFLVAKKTGKYDRNILPKEKGLRQLIKSHAGKYEIGIHPSWQSGDDHSLLKKEIETLENISGRKIKASRQHFIRFNLPGTYRRLIEAGISEDYSMGYGSTNGFRASVASPFYWYDLEKEKATDLLLYPFCFMEANSFFEQKQTSMQGLEEMRNYYKAVKVVNGTFVSIWHNTFLGTDPLYLGWREAYKSFIVETATNK